MTNTDVHYGGTDNLEVMADARNYNRFLVDLVVAAADGRQHAVDFGAGIGTIALMVRERGLDVICVEADPAQREKLAGQAFVALPSVESVPDGTLQYVYSLNVIEHIVDDRAAIRSFARKLSPQGRLFIYVPAFEMLFSSMDRKVGHVRRYRKSQLVRLVEETGLKVLRVSYVDSLGFLATVLYKTLGSNTGTPSRTSIIIFDRVVFPVSRVLDSLMGRFVGKNAYIIATK